LLYGADVVRHHSQDISGAIIFDVHVNPAITFRRLLDLVHSPCPCTSFMDPRHWETGQDEGQAR
jgi:hypothetical protein